MRWILRTTPLRVVLAVLVLDVIACVGYGGAYVTLVVPARGRAVWGAGGGRINLHPTYPAIESLLGTPAPEEIFWYAQQIDRRLRPERWAFIREGPIGPIRIDAAVFDYRGRDVPQPPASTGSPQPP